ncbi:MAG: VTT domain-containing protein [Gemmatimonadota bacterium]
MSRFRFTVAGLAAALALSCGAPASRPASGPIADEVRTALESGRASFDHAAWGELLANGTRAGLVDYPYFQRHRADLDTYLSRIAEAHLAELAPAELKALLINAYNALTVRSILDHPSVSSIKEIDGVWTDVRHRVGRHEVTLDNIEHNLLRPFFKDPRIHFAVNCASMSCAPLPPWAFTGNRLDAQLDERMEAFLRNPANVRVEDGSLLLSRYFEWYGEDFVAEGWAPRAESVPEFVAAHARPEVDRFIRQANKAPPVRFLDYDWSLNAAVPPAPAPDSSAGSASRGGSADLGKAAGIGPGDGRASTGWVARLRNWVQGFGPAAPLVYGLVYILGVVFFLPGSSLTIGAGLLFGIGLGTLVVALSATTGASLAFLLARHWMRHRVEGWVERRPRLAAVDRAVASQGWKVVALTRLSPAFPFNVLNYFYGLTAVGFWPYALTSALTMLPGTLLYVYIGVAGADVTSALTGAADWGATALKLTGLAATLLVVVLVTRVARRELDRATAEFSAVTD